MEREKPPSYRLPPKFRKVIHTGLTLFALGASVVPAASVRDATFESTLEPFHPRPERTIQPQTQENAIENTQNNPHTISRLRKIAEGKPILIHVEPAGAKLEAGWNLVGWDGGYPCSWWPREEDFAVEKNLAPLLDLGLLKIAWRYSKDEGWQFYTPAAPPAPNTLKRICQGDLLWLNLKQEIAINEMMVRWVAQDPKGWSRVGVPFMLTKSREDADIAVNLKTPEQTRLECGPSSGACAIPGLSPCKVIISAVPWQYSWIILGAANHEWGHCFGLDHNDDPTSVMGEGQQTLKPATQDIQAVLDKVANLR